MIVINASKKLRTENSLIFECRVIEDRLQALSNGKVFFEMVSRNISFDLLFNRSSSIIAQHPQRNKNLKCIYFLYLKPIEKNIYEIGSCQYESEVPKNSPLIRNWLANRYLKEEKTKRKDS